MRLWDVPDWLWHDNERRVQSLWCWSLSDGSWNIIVWRLQLVYEWNVQYWIRGICLYVVWRWNVPVECWSNQLRLVYDGNLSDGVRDGLLE